MRAIEQSLERGEFFCHETLTDNGWQEDAEGEDGYHSSGAEEHCAGPLTLLEKLGRPSQMMRIAERLHGADGSSLYDCRKLDMDAPVFGSFDAMANTQNQKLE